MSTSEHADAARFAELFGATYLLFHRRDGKRAQLSGASRAVLMHLAQAGPLTVSEAAEHLDRAQSVVSATATQMAGHGLHRVLGQCRPAQEQEWNAVQQFHIYDVFLILRAATRYGADEGCSSKCRRGWRALQSWGQNLASSGAVGMKLAQTFVRSMSLNTKTTSLDDIEPQQPHSGTGVSRKGKPLKKA